jgi:hypothetical protein
MKNLELQIKMLTNNNINTNIIIFTFSSNHILFIVVCIFSKSILLFRILSLTL